MNSETTASAEVAQVRPAATVVLVRSVPDGIEVFMVQRHRRSGFFPNAWVFPGGKVDEADTLSGHPRVRGRLVLPGLSDFGATAHGVAAYRETFEEAGIWLGEGAPTGAEREGLISGDLSLLALLDHGATVDLDMLKAWSWWITPTAEPKRFDTRFLVAVAEGTTGRHDGQETVDSRWVNPRDALVLDMETFPVAPPTWWTLRELAAFSSAEAVFDGANAPAVPVLPVRQLDDAGFTLLLPGHPDHGAPPIAQLPDRITFDGRWIAWNGDEALPAVPDAH